MMAEDKKEIVPARYDVEAKWDACVDLTVRRTFYSSLAGAFGGLLLFRSPAARWSSIAFGAGLGIGSAYTQCSQQFNGFPTKPPPKASDVSAHETVVESSPQGWNQGMKDKTEDILNLKYTRSCSDGVFSN